MQNRSDPRIEPRMLLLDHVEEIHEFRDERIYQWPWITVALFHAGMHGELMSNEQLRAHIGLDDAD